MLKIKEKLKILICQSRVEKKGQQFDMLDLY